MGLRNSNFSAGPAVGPKTTAPQAVPVAHAAITFNPQPNGNDDDINVILPSSNNSHITHDVDAGLSTPTFKDWKGETANAMLAAFWEVSGGDRDFILTMAAENGSFDPYLKHQHTNRNGTRDYSFGLNYKYHKAFIDRILAKEASLEEIAKYHWDIYNLPDYQTSCGRKRFCGYNVRQRTAKLFNF